MIDARTQAEAQAIDWLVRLRDGDGIDWSELTSWLEASAHHRAAFDQLSLLDSELDRLSAHRVKAQEGRSLRRWTTAGAGLGALAAAAAVAIVFVPSADEYRIQTHPGQHRALTLADGSRVELNGSSTIVLSRSNPRLAQLERGEAYFDVIHHSEKPFTVRAGDLTITDVGTAFNVLRIANVTEVGVTQGVVALRSGSRSLQVNKGTEVKIDGAKAELSRVSNVSIAGWRTGELTYLQARVERIARDIERTRGVRIQVDPGVAQRTFSGTIQLDGSEADISRRLAMLTGVEAVRTAAGWRLVPSNASQH